MTGATLLVVRHAPVAWAGVCYGQSEVPTRVPGDAACETVCAQLVAARLRVGRVWSSPWRRTAEPAALLAERLGVPLTVDPRLSELAFGTWEGRRWAEIESEPRFLEWMGDYRHVAPPGGERLVDLIARVRTWRSELPADESMVAWTHAGVIRVLRADARGLDYAEVAMQDVRSLELEPIAEGPGPSMLRPSP